MKTKNDNSTLNLGQGVFRNRLKSLLHVYSFLSTSFKVWNVIFRVTPLLSSLGGHGSVVQVDLVAEYDKREVVWVTRAGLHGDNQSGQWFEIYSPPG